MRPSSGERSSWLRSGKSRHVFRHPVSLWAQHRMASSVSSTVIFFIGMYKYVSSETGLCCNDNVASYFRVIWLCFMFFSFTRISLKPAKELKGVLLGRWMGECLPTGIAGLLSTTAVLGEARTVERRCMQEIQNRGQLVNHRKRR